MLAGMKIACLTPFYNTDHGPDNFSTRLRDEFIARGHDYVVVHPNDVVIHYRDAQVFPIHHSRIAMADVDMYTHSLRADDVWAWEIVACLREWGKRVIRPNRVPHDDKVTMARLFTRAGITVPETAVCSSLDHALQSAAKMGYPLVGKARTGSQGRNVRMIENNDQMRDFVTFAAAIATNFLLQKVVLPLGRDVRAFIVGGRVVAAMERFANDGDFRANYSLSGKAAPTVLTPEEERVAVSVTDVYQAPYAGVDFVRTPNGPVVLEINKAPAVRGIEAVTGINVAGMIVAYFEQQMAGNDA